MVTSDRWKKILILLGSLVLLFSFIYLNKVTYVSPEEHISRGLNNLLVDSPRMREMWESGGRVLRVTISHKVLPPGVLGRTEITEETAAISIDVNQVIQKNDRFEPVIGHEILHINDALFKYGMRQFLEISQKEKHLDWYQKTLEKSAMEQEDVLRGELLTTGKYSGMARSRWIQNKR